MPSGIQCPKPLFYAFSKARCPSPLSAVVMQELAAGARTRAQARHLERFVFRPFVKRGRLFAPRSNAFVHSGRLIASLAAREGWAIIHDNPSLLNDALLAASCREHGITLITQDADFDRLAPLMKGWRHLRPWPRPAATR